MDECRALQRRRSRPCSAARSRGSGSRAGSRVRCARALGARPVDRDRVERRDDRAERHAGVEVDGDREVVAGARAFRRHRRRQTRGVGDAIGVGAQPVPAWPVGVPGTKRGPTTVGNENSKVPSANFSGSTYSSRISHLGARHQVRERLREDVRTLLVEEARELPGGARGLVDAARVLAALDVAADHALAGRASSCRRPRRGRRAGRCRSPRPARRRGSRRSGSRRRGRRSPRSRRRRRCARADRRRAACRPARCAARRAGSSGAAASSAARRRACAARPSEERERHDEAQSAFEQQGHRGRGHG